VRRSPILRVHGRPFDRAITKALTGWPVVVPEDGVTMPQAQRLADPQAAVVEQAAQRVLLAHRRQDGLQVVTTAKDTMAFTTAAPLNPAIGRRLAITIRNASVGVLGNITWDAVFKTSWNNAADKPANAFSLTLHFKYDGTNWMEIGKTPASVPN
jgi:hypothetical protein